MRVLSTPLKFFAIALFAFVASVFLVFPAKAQCALTAWMGGGLCYDWLNMFSRSTIRIYRSGGKAVEASTPWGSMYGEWVRPGDAVLDAGDQLICCYGQRSTGQQYGFCRPC